MKQERPTCKDAYFQVPIAPVSARVNGYEQKRRRFEPQHRLGHVTVEQAKLKISIRLI